MSKKTKSKKSSRSARAGAGFVGCCGKAGGPEYVNDQRNGAAPSAQRYQDAPTTLVAACRDATRVTAAHDIRYAGRVWSNRQLFTAADLRAFRRTRRSSHQMRELVKGIVQRHPLLQTASREQLALEVTYQLLQATGMPTVPKTWAEVLKELVNYMPLGAITSSMSLMRRHDRDIEVGLNGPFWAKHLPGRPTPVTVADRQLLVHDFVRRRWQAGARSGRTQVTTCDELKRRFPCALYKAPWLVVDKRRGRRGPLTDQDILGI